MAALLFARAGFVRIVRPFSDFYVAGRLVPALLNSLAIAASVLAILAFVGLSGGIGMGWDGAAAVLVGGGIGLVLAGLLFAPYLRSFGGYTLPDFLAERFPGDGVRPLAVLAIVVCSFPALAAILLALGWIAATVFAIPFGVAMGGGLLFIFLATLRAGLRSLSLSQIAYYAVCLLASVVAVCVVAWQSGSLFAEDVLVLDEVVPTLGLGFFTQSSPLNTAALMFCLAVGIASLPYVLMRAFTTPTEREARGSFVAAPIFAGLLCLAAPAFAALFEAAWVRAGDALYMIAEATLTVAGLAGLLAAGGALTLSVANTVSYDLYYKTLRPTATARQQLLAARLAVIVVAGLAALAAMTFPEQTLIATGAGLSLAASAFFPVLLLGIWWKRVTTDAAIAGMAAGLLVCLYYMVAPHVIPFAFYESSSLLSDATSLDAARYEALRHSYYLAEEGAAQTAVLTEWDAAAREVANWGGVHGTLAGLFAVPAGLLVTVIASLFARTPSDNARRFVDRLRMRPA